MVSDGKTPPDGLMPATTTECIFIKDFHMHLGKSHREFERKRNSVSGRGGISFGPFWGGGSHAQKSDQRSHTSLSDEQGFHIPGLQLLVFYTQQLQTGPKFARTLHGVNASSPATQRLTPAVKFGTAVAGGRPATRNFSAIKNLRVTVNKDARAFYSRRQTNKSMGINGVVRDINQQVLEGVAVTVTLLKGQYKISVRTDQHLFKGQIEKTINLQANQEHQFTLIPKAVLSSDKIHLVGFVCQQVPLVSAARFGCHLGGLNGVVPEAKFARGYEMSTSRAIWRRTR